MTKNTGNQSGAVHNWLFLRGLIREKRHWESFPEIFAEGFGPNHKIHFLDLPGVGTEWKRSSPNTLGGIMEDLRHRWIALRAIHPGDWSMLSISLGSMVGMTWAIEYPEDFKHLVVMNTSAGNLSLPTERLNWKMLPKVLRAISKQAPREKEKLIISMTTNLRTDLEDLSHRWGLYATEYPVSKTTAARQLGAATLFRLPQQLPIPTLVLSSAKDRFTDFTCSEKLAKYLGASIETHPEAGHDISLDDGPWVVEKVKNWLQSQ